MRRGMISVANQISCGPGSIPAGAIRWLSLLLVLAMLRRFSLGLLWFSSLHKNQNSQIPIRPGNSLLAEVSHDVNDGRETSAGFRPVV